MIFDAQLLTASSRWANAKINPIFFSYTHSKRMLFSTPACPVPSSYVESWDGMVQPVLAPCLAWTPRWLLYYFSSLLRLCCSPSLWYSYHMIRTSPPVTYTTTPPISKRTAFLKAAKLHPHPPLLVVFKAAPSSRSLVMLNGLLTRYQRSSWEKQACQLHSAAYQVAGTRYQRPLQQPSSKSSTSTTSTTTSWAPAPAGASRWWWWWWWWCWLLLLVVVVVVGIYCIRCCCCVLLRHWKKNNQVVAGTRGQRS